MKRSISIYGRSKRSSGLKYPTAILEDAIDVTKALLRDMQTYVADRIEEEFERKHRKTVEAALKRAEELIAKYKRSGVV